MRPARISSRIVQVLTPRAAATSLTLNASRSVFISLLLGRAVRLPGLLCFGVKLVKTGLVDADPIPTSTATGG